MLTISKLTLGYASRVVVEDVSFALQPGEIGCLLGPSGCGKSSILRAICGFQPLMKGEIVINGQQVVSPRVQLPAQQRNVGMVFQDYALFPHLTVAENVGFGISDKRHAVDRKQRVAECLELVGMLSEAKRMPHELSGGQQQRVAVARALAPRPGILLLDEPFSSLDVALRETLSSDVRLLLKEQGITGLLVTHDQKEAFAVADCIGVLNDKKLHQWGTADQLYHAPETEFVARFVGEGVVLSPEVVNKTQWSLVRPENVHIHKNGKYSGKIVSRQFRGSHFLYRVQMTDVGQKDTNLLAYANMELTYDVGDAVQFDVDVGKVTSLPRAH